LTRKSALICRNDHIGHSDLEFCEVRDVSNKYFAREKYTDWRQRHIVCCGEKVIGNLCEFWRGAGNILTNKKICFLFICFGDDREASSQPCRRATDSTLIRTAECEGHQACSSLSRYLRDSHRFRKHKRCGLLELAGHPLGRYC